MSNRKKTTEGASPAVTTTPIATTTTPTNKTLKLSDGRTAELRPLRVRDAIEARRIVAANSYVNKGAEPDPQEISAAMLAQILHIDGQPQHYKAVLDLYFVDFVALATEMGTGFTPADLPAS